MWHYPSFDPVAISLGPVSIKWYAISYLVGIALIWWLLGIRNRQLAKPWSQEALSDIVFYAVLGAILGGRVGYMLFYGTSSLLADPIVIFKVWQGGMSFHGGLLGVLIATFVYARRYRRRFFEVTDFVAPAIPLALGCGRIGNFINGELPGRIAEVPWAVIYPGDIVARHPSSLYQAVLEGPVLFALLWLFSRKPRPEMAVSGLFLTGYGSLRVFSEFFREPDSHIGYIAFNWMTEGQLLSLPMILFGMMLMVAGYRRTR